MPTANKPRRPTVTINDTDLYQALRLAAAERDKSIRQIVVEALRDWLHKQEYLEDQEDLAAIAQTDGEETYPWEQVKHEMRQARESSRAS